MRRLLEQLLQLIMKLGNSILIGAMIFAPYPQVYAQAETKPEVYNPGEEFQDSLTDINEDPNLSGVKGVLEQFVSLSFSAAAVSSISFTHTQRSTFDCSANNNANITIRMMQAAALALLLGEVRAKKEFKDASQLALDNVFTPQPKLDENASIEELRKRNSEQNQKQLEAYNTLIKVYEGKIKGIKTKKKLAMAAEVALLGALATELSMVNTQKRMCDMNVAQYESQNAATKASLKSLMTSVKAYGAAQAVCPGPCNAVEAAACSGAATSLGTLLGNLTASEQAQSAQAQVQNTEAQSKSIGEDGWLSETIGGIVSSFSLENIMSKVGILKGSVEAEGATELTTQQTREASGESTKIANRGKDKALWAAPKAAGCSTCGACSAAYTSLEKSHELNKQAPLQCCGADIASQTNGHSNYPYPSIMDKKVDIQIQKLPIVGSHTVDFLKPIVMNTVVDLYFAKHGEVLKKLPPKLALRKIKSLYAHLELIDQDLENLILNSPEIKGLESVNPSEKLNLKNILADLNFSIMSEAHASGFQEVLGFGIKLYQVTKLFGDFFKEKALNKPKNRMWTFGTMAGFNGIIIKFYGDQIKENEKHADIIRKDRDIFKRSHALKDGLDVDSLDGHNLNHREGVLDLERRDAEDLAQLPPELEGLKLCAEKDKNGFRPAECRDKKLKGGPVEIMKGIPKRSLPIQLASLPQNIDEAINSAARGEDFINSKRFKEKLGSLNKQRNSLVSLVKDELKKNDINKFDEKKKAPKGSLRTILSQIQPTPDLQSNESDNLAALPKLKKLESTVTQTQKRETKKLIKPMEFKFETPAMPEIPKNDFPFFANDSSARKDESNSRTVASTEGAKNFNYRNVDIHERDKASIFDIISSRYKKSYHYFFDLETK